MTPSRSLSPRKSLRLAGWEEDPAEISKLTLKELGLG